MNIESGIPIPPKGRRRSEAGDKARAMGVGESLFCATETQYNTARGALHDLGRKCTSRIEGAGWRIWRLA